MKSNLIIYSEYDISEEHLKSLNNSKTIGIDTEALGLQLHRDRLCLIQICDYSTGLVYIVHFKTPNYSKSKNLIKVLKNKKIEKIFHFARFDMAIIYKYLQVMCENIFCTKILSKIARTYTERHGLKELCSKLLSVELNKSNGCSYWGADLNESQKKYATDDVIHLLDLKNKLVDMLEKENRLEIAMICIHSIEMAVRCDLAFYDPSYILNHH
jgi:ribonuclease D